MLIGQYEGKVSEKFQIAFPKKFREILGDRLIITKGFEGYLLVVSEKDWETLLEGTQGLPFTNTRARKLQRFLLGNASEVELDDKGRFVLPEYLRLHAEIKDEVIYAGISRFVEIWNKDRWNKEQERLANAMPNVSDRLDEGMN